MECKDTGEFAHRESTEYEQTEVFNKELVSTEHGNEEYVHLKSQHDEYEHLESNMPKNRQRGGEEEAGAAGEHAEQPEPVQDEGAEAMPADSPPPPMWQPGQSPPEMGSPGAWHHDGMPQNMWQASPDGYADEDDAEEPQWWGAEGQPDEAHNEWVAPPLVAGPEEAHDEWVAPPLVAGQEEAHDERVAPPHVAGPEEAHDEWVAPPLVAGPEEAHDEWVAPPLVTEPSDGGLTEPVPDRPQPEDAIAGVAEGPGDACTRLGSESAKAQPELAPIFTSAVDIGDID